MRVVGVESTPQNVPHMFNGFRSVDWEGQSIRDDLLLLQKVLDDPCSVWGSVVVQ